MLQWIAEPSQEQIAAVVACFAKLNPLEWRSADDIRALLAEGGLLFDVSGKGVVLVHVTEAQGERRLMIDALNAPMAWIRGLVRDMQRLAADWNCTTIETTLFDPRLARAILLCGAEQEAVVLALPVRRL
jgi:hypothetical protein